MAVHKNPSANAGDMGLIPGLGRFHKAHKPQLLRPCAEACAPQQEKLCNEKPVHCSEE